MVPALFAAWGPVDTPGWSYRREITISNVGTALTSYQIRLHLTDTANMKADGADLRFTDFANTILYPYWVESWAAGDSYVWVKVPSIPTGDSYMWMWYGNPNANTLSDGDDTFVFFDDFLGTSLDSSKWSAYDGTPVVGNSKVELQLDDGITTTVLTATDPSYAWDYDFQCTNVVVIGAISYRILMESEGDYYAQYIDFNVPDPPPPLPSQFQFRRRDNGLPTGLIEAGWDLDTERHEVTVTRLSGGNWEIFYDGVSKGTVGDNTYSQLNIMAIRVGWAYPGTVYIDVYRVRSYSSPEPTSAIGTGPVGGYLIPADKLAVFAPYFALLGVIAAITLVIVAPWKKRDD